MAKANHKLMEPDENCAGQFNASTGFLWRAKKTKKQSRKAQTAGSLKGENCKAGPLDRFMAKRNRSYKHREYAGWCERMKKKREKAGG
jgi:hypothetical protein